MGPKPQKGARGKEGKGGERRGKEGIGGERRGEEGRETERSKVTVHFCLPVAASSLLSE